MSETDSQVDLLRGVEVFRGASDDDLRNLVAMAREAEFPKGETIFREYDEAKEVYAIVSGSVALSLCHLKQNCRQIATVADGGLLGWSPLLGRMRLSDTAYTLSPVKAFVFDGAELMNYCEANPKFGFAFMRQAASVLAERLSATRLQLFDVHHMNLPEATLESD